MMNTTMMSINGSMNTTSVRLPRWQRNQQKCTVRNDIFGRLCPSIQRTNLSYTRDYIFIANFLGMALIPFTLLAIVNFKLFRTIKVKVEFKEE